MNTVIHHLYISKLKPSSKCPEEAKRQIIYHFKYSILSDLLSQVCIIRNDLSHMKIDNSMVLDDQTTKRYFSEMVDLVTAFHPQYFSQDEVFKLVKEFKQVSCIISGVKIFWKIYGHNIGFEILDYTII